MAEFDWGDYLSFAQEIEADKLFASYPDLKQAAYRTAISRAYYSVFHQAKDFAEFKMGTKFSKKGVHNLVVGFYRITWSQYLDSSYSANCKIIRDRLIRMKRAREKADYNCVSIFDQTSSVTKAILDAYDLLEVLEKPSK